MIFDYDIDALDPARLVSEASYGTTDYRLCALGSTWWIERFGLREVLRMDRCGAWPVVYAGGKLMARVRWSEATGEFLGSESVR